MDEDDKVMLAVIGFTTVLYGIVGYCLVCLISELMG